MSDLASKAIAGGLVASRVVLVLDDPVIVKLMTGKIHTCSKEVAKKQAVIQQDQECEPWGGGSRAFHAAIV